MGIDIETNAILFVGSPRTGSTLLGQILNFHPNCLISHEFNLLAKGMDSPDDVPMLINKLKAEALDQYQNGLEESRSFGDRILNYQSRWKGFSELSRLEAFRKSEIKFVGDKKAGGNSLVYSKRPGDVAAFLSCHRGWRLIQIIRDPVRAALSYVKSHGIASFQEACATVLERTCDGLKMTQTVGNSSYILYYEDLVTEPKLEIHKLVKWLELESTDSWFDLIAEKVDTGLGVDGSSQNRKDFVEILRRSNIPENIGDYFKRYL